MRSTRGALLTLVVLGGTLIWRNRFAIQRQLEALGVRTPLLRRNLREVAHSVAAKAAGRMEHGATIAEHVDRKAA